MNLKWLPALALATQLHAATIDLGPNGTSYNRSFDFDQLNQTRLNGQTLSFDLIFNNSVHLFGGTLNFGLLLGLQTDGQGLVGFTSGTGSLLDPNGNWFSVPCGSASEYNGRMFVGLLPLKGQLDFYGAQFDITLPNIDGLTITDGSVTLLCDDALLRDGRTKPFRIGPHVPDKAPTLGLLLLGLVCIFLYDQKTAR